MKMRRHLSLVSWRFIRYQSFAAGLFNSKVIPNELFPYPTRVFDSEEAENVQSAIEQIRNNDKEFNTGGLQIALEYGGLGLSHTSHALVCEELGSSCDSALLTNIEHSGLCSYFINTFGTRELKGKYLTGMSDTKIKMGWAVLENNGFDLSMNSTEAVLEDGHYVLSGEKFCAFATSRTHYLVLAKVNTQVETDNGPKESRRNSMFIVEKGTPGVSVEGSYVKFNRARVSDLVGVVGEGYKDAMITISICQYILASVLLGSLRRAIQELCDSVKEKWSMSTTASCACFLYAMESVIYAVTANYDKPTEDSFIETALACTFIQECADDWLSTLSSVIPSTSQVFDTCLKNARLLLSLMQSSDLLKAEAVCCGVEDYGLFFQRTSTVQVMQMRTARSLGVIDHIPVSSIDCSSIDKAIVNFGNAVESTFVRNTSAVPEQKLLIDRLGKSANLLYAAAAVASRAAMCASKELPTTKTELELAKIFITYATNKANELSYECTNVGLTADDLYKRIALEICEDALQEQQEINPLFPENPFSS